MALDEVFGSVRIQKGDIKGSRLMDRMVYTAMQGAQTVLHRQATNNNNLANLTTTGFRTDLDLQEEAPLEGLGFPARVGVTINAAVPDLTPGELVITGRDLDLAIRGRGFLAVQAANGTEAYTRAGELRVGEGGLLETASGHLVLGNTGPIFIPPADALEIAEDGSVSVVPAGQDVNTPVNLDRIKLVDLPASKLERTPEGLFELRPDSELPDGDVLTVTTVAVKVTNGALENSNANAAEGLATMIELARNFEMNVRMMQVSEQIDEASVSLLRLS